MQSGIQIVSFTDDLSTHFKELNLAWIKKYFYVEPADEEALSNPEKYIIDKGGHIFFAFYNNTVAGTFALIKNSEDEYELAKMAVDEKSQGKGIGHVLLTVAIQKAKELKAQKLVLYSNTVLAPAIHLYKKMGFVEVPMGTSDYKRSNIKMEKEIL